MSYTQVIFVPVKKKGKGLLEKKEEVPRVSIVEETSQDFVVQALLTEAADTVEVFSRNRDGGNKKRKKEA